MISRQEDIHFFVFRDKVVFIPLRYLYPECLFLIKDNEALSPLICLQNNSCHVGASCMEMLAKRIHYILNYLEPSAELIIAYFKQGTRIRAGIFTHTFDNPRVTTINPYAFRSLQKKSVAKRWTPSLEFCGLSKVSDVISPSSLIVK